MKLIEIFKPGRHTSMSGEVVEFSEADLRASAEAYDPSLHEAPLVVGHPKTDDPAYGWVQSISYADSLSVTPHQVDPAFAELVNAGRFKKISASFYKPDSPANPKPGVYYLRHVGFLGAAPPAVKGLKSASFAASDDGVIEFGDWADAQSASLWRKMREFLIEKFGMSDADKAVPDYLVQSLEDSARSTEPNPISAYTETDTSKTKETEMDGDIKQREAAIKDREQKIKDEEAAFAERAKKLAEQEAAARRKQHADFADSLVKDGKVLPKDRDGLIAFLQTISADTVIEFGEGDKKQTPAATAWFAEFLKQLPKAIEFNERAGSGMPAQLPSDPTAIASRAIAFQEQEAKSGRTINIAEAVAHVTAGGK